MRLVCPNCDAEYEVDPSVIPTSGRDVQCSNCGTSWFQPSPVAEAAAAEEAALFDAPPPEPIAAVHEPAAKPRGLDESVVAVLREEAEREAAARRAEASQPIQTQTELGLTGAAPAAAPAAASPAVASPAAANPAAANPAAANPAAASAAAQRIAMLKGAEAEPRAARRPQTRRDMLPAIEEINSTLRATSERRTGEPAAVAHSLPAPPPASNAFRNGFVLMLMIAAIGLFGYLMAPRIGQQIPGLAAVMSRYVDTVDSARTWLDQVLQQAIATLRGLSDDGAT